MRNLPLDLERTENIRSMQFSVEMPFEEWLSELGSSGCQVSVEGFPSKVASGAVE
jgi:hypothetical protein